MSSRDQQYLDFFFKPDFVFSIVVELRVEEAIFKCMSLSKRNQSPNDSVNLKQGHEYLQEERNGRKALFLCFSAKHVRVSVEREH